MLPDGTKNDRKRRGNRSHRPLEQDPQEVGMTQGRRVVFLGRRGGLDPRALPWYTRDPAELGLWEVGRQGMYPFISCPFQRSHPLYHECLPSGPALAFVVHL